MINFTDALYGNITINLENDHITTPELQRLRSIRLCNINSPYVTAGDCLNRFEHAIGTAYLSQQHTKNINISNHDRNAFVLASLYHDIVTAPFGHSLEYLFESIRGIEYEHADIWKMFLSGETVQATRNIYFGGKFSLNSIFDHETISTIAKILDGEHSLSNILVNSIDIDNIDNVFRFAYHIGIPFNKTTPERLACLLKYDNDCLIIDSNNKHLYKEWFKTRNILYKYLLENDGEFIAKSLLERIFIEAINDNIITVNDWILTDNQLLEKIYAEGNSTAKATINMLMTMKFPKKSLIVYSPEHRTIDNFLENNKFKEINKAFSKGIYLHFIKDVNKTKRSLLAKDKDSKEKYIIGDSNDRYLIGFFSNDLPEINNYRKNLEDILGIELQDLNKMNTNESSKQLSLF